MWPPTILAARRRAGRKAATASSYIFCHEDGKPILHVKTFSKNAGLLQPAAQAQRLTGNHEEWSGAGRGLCGVKPAEHIFIAGLLIVQNF